MRKDKDADDTDPPMRAQGRQSDENEGEIPLPALAPSPLHLYVLKLAGGHFYVGITTDIDRRFRQHQMGEGAQWTRLHKPEKIVHREPLHTNDWRIAEKRETDVTAMLMGECGREKVRGGRYTQRDEAWTTPALKAHGHWERIQSAHLNRKAINTDDSWNDAVNDFLTIAIAYHDSEPADQQDENMYAAAHRLTRYREWRTAFDPMLNIRFWGRKLSILPVLLSIKLHRPVGSMVPTAYDVLANAMIRTRHGAAGVRHLYLHAWQTYQPEITPNQEKAIASFIQALAAPHERDHQYDEIVSVLFPECRARLRRYEP
ncbi:GIY-YIG nuclease family protein [Achromobacter xylosoxidans]|uniref:GIY-YIG nuclease family protein n=1 Tax=Alcaligenes xylosoxydans xylosoxydans TaxID=85698 RepID=UPI001F147CA2|nr:GIY-YIG nuclease family protein [Achromobacter xylosoxidans]